MSESISLSNSYESTVSSSNETKVDNVVDEVQKTQPVQQKKPTLAELIAMQKAGTLPKQYTQKEKIAAGTDMSNGSVKTQQVETTPTTTDKKPTLAELIAMQKAGTLPKQYTEKEKIAAGTDLSNGNPPAKKPTLAELIAMQKAGNLPKQYTQKEKIAAGTDMSNGSVKTQQVETTPTQTTTDKKPTLAELLAMQKAGTLPNEFQKQKAPVEEVVKRESFIHREISAIEEEVSKYGDGREAQIKEENLYYSERELTVLQNMFEFFMKKAPNILSTMFSNRDKAEELADAVLNLTYSKRLALDFVSQMLKEEFETHTDSHSLFRENTSATRVAKSFLAKVGRKYLLDIYKPFVQEIIHSDISFEIDDHRETDKEKLETNKQNLFEACRKLFDLVIDSFDLLPPGVKLLARIFNEYAAQFFGELSDDSRNSLTGSFIMLRYINPAIFSPEKYGIVDDPKEISMSGRRNLILLSKVLQNLSNGVKFIQEKEPFMLPLNVILDEYLDKFKRYFRRIVNVAKNFPFVLVVEETAITDMKPIALIHKELCERADEIIGTSSSEISEEFCKYMVSLGKYSDKTHSFGEFKEEIQIKLKEFLIKNKHEAVYISSFSCEINGNKIDGILIVTLHHIVILDQSFNVVKEIHVFDIQNVTSANKMGMSFQLKDGTSLVGETVHPDQIIIAMLRSFKSSFADGVYGFVVDVPSHRSAAFKNVFSLQTFNTCGGFSGIYNAFCTYKKVPINESVQAFIEGTKEGLEGAKELNCLMFNTTDPNNKNDAMSPTEFQPVLSALRTNKYFTKLNIESTSLVGCEEELKKVLEDNETLECIRLNDVGIKEWDTILCAYIEKNKSHNIKEIDLGNNKLESKALASLAKIIVKYQINKINLNHCISNDKSISSFFEGFQECLEKKIHLPLTSLKLEGAKMGSESLDFMTNQFAKIFPNLMELNLSNLDVKNSGEVVNVLKGLNFLVQVDLSGISIGKKTETGLAKIVSTLNNLKELHLRNCSIPATVLKEVIENLKSSEVILDLQGMQFDDEGINSLAESIKINKNIISFDISQTNVKDKGLSKILDALVENTVVETLNISKTINGDDTEGLMAALLKYLKKATSLKNLILEGGNKTDQQLGLNMIPVLNSLVKNEHIVSLDIQSQGMGNKGAFALANLLKITKTLQTLKWDQNEIGIFGLRAVVDSMRVNTSVKELQLPILDCRALRVQGKFNDGNKIIGELVKSVQKKGL
ncbi:hypothetical protein CL6EHI_174140 [Entamoeba histolytica]|uniref:Ras-GAP domain-containing protein n=4 Tax=Entamoeba histolytica TaxID=5759 RepID=C4M262_ENTH1|nr:hypothetical protein EHI_174140 [Entamoeba histolytica HM-1:IMSS]EAL47110.2 hypothetical protein EHI_174140 [Entamoeba histolytica HM-1:IMSS]GAT95353.1 hypothetical protein CL6EHI_174140 [Entamoeba histolytica]|eukprot:XP_652496.2 hypothetical protein EHI_174140 [Entamoeba histolytica HM-1:IMSS]